MEGLVVAADFWRDKRVFLTGHTGFKGGWLSLWLQSMGADLRGFSLSPPTHPNLFSLADVASGMASVIGDIRNRELLTTELTGFQPDTVFHLAAQSLVRESYRDPVTTYATNVMGTVHLLEAVRATSSVRTVIIVTSDKCYENREWPWGYREHEPMGGYDPYASSKGCSELVTSAYRHSFLNHEQRPISIATVRAGNVIGGGDWASDRLIPDLVRACIQNTPARIRHPRAVRPWQHVLEPLSGYLQLAQKLLTHPEYSEGWNFGPEFEDAKPVEWIANRVCALWGEDAGWQGDEQPHPHEAAQLRLDCSKARAVLGWKPKLDLAAALEQSIAWYKAFNNDENMRAYTLQQLNQYHATEIA